MLNSEVLRFHEDRSTLVQQRKTIDNKFFIYVENIIKHIWLFGGLGGWGGGGASIIRLGPS